MMRAINALACQRVSTGQFATFFLAVLHEPTLTFRFTNAGHNFPVLQRAGGGRELLETGGVVVGMLDAPEYEEGVLQLEPGDRIVFYTDGVSEAERADGEMYGEERLYARLDDAPRAMPAERLVEHVLAGVREHLDGTEAGDDITVMALRVLESDTARA
jgi:sigma-B regulation protein RsbU (phosphoserine phosphatase)